MQSDDTPLIRQPLYRQIADLLRERYVTGQPEGVRLPPERQLAEHLRVSAVTIRTALRELERDQLVERRQGSGTYVLPPPTRRKHIAVVLECDISSPNLSPYYLRLLQEVRLNLLKAGYSHRPYLGYLRLGVEIGELTCREFFEELREDRIAGVIMILAQNHPSWAAELHKRAIPYVGHRKSSEYTVGVDLEAMTHAILAQLQARGCQRLGLVGHNDRHREQLPTIQLMRNFAPQYGITVRKEWTCEDVTGLEAGHGRRAIERIWRATPERPDSFYVACDVLGEECLDTIENLQIEAGHEIPLALFGSDAVKVAPRPNLLHCLHAVAATGTAMVEVMQRRLQHQPVPRITPVAFHFAHTKSQAVTSP